MTVELRHQIKRGIVFSWIFTLAVLNVFSTTYYVSRAEGNDSYNGLSPTYQGGSNGPWLTIRKVNSSWSSYQPGDSILFKRGDSWITGQNEAIRIRKSGSAAGGYITFGAYGSGQKPIISHNATVDYPVVYLIENNTSYIIIENLNLRAEPAGSGFSGRPGCHHIIVRYCDVSASGYVGISSDYIDTYEFAYNNVDVEGTVGIYIGGSSTTKTTNGWVHHNTVNGGTDCISIHEGEGYNPGPNHVVEYNTLGWAAQPNENCVDMAFTKLDTIPTGLVVRGNICKGSEVGALGLNGNGTIVEHNFVYYGGNQKWEALIIGNYSSNFKVRYNIFTDGGQPSGAAILFNDIVTNTEIYNNVVCNSSASQRSSIVIPPANSNITIKNNAFINNVNGCYLVQYNGTATPANTNSVLDHNCYYSTLGDANKFYAGGTHYNFATWKSTWNQDAHSKFENPQFVNESGNYSVDTDFAISQTSPCFDSGTNVSLTQDYFGNTVPQNNAPEIGVYEFLYEKEILPEINIKYDSTNLDDGGAFDYGTKVIGSNTDQIFTLENLGNANLTLSESPVIVITGPNADQFRLQRQPSNPVLPRESTIFTIRFSPTSTGAKKATIAIANNDSDEDPYNISLLGRGRRKTSL